ncbi:stalk domain-containing protein [Paenibacillus abyssi]|uniref:Copper amine oxidase-like N-terminal domain-containing protein n=1 Tax=Paenibacillus abyssi TaxID=1340531 RepID=A0A917G1V6_9BACL|nr:stalk domain-containing protein [Paenibacillus abyssi]GGG18248.1 hypothetical protein GCM10010916_38840 [Paenibacillus abyssi]
MSKSKNIRLIATGFVVGALFFGGVSYAATKTATLNAVFGVKLVQNGIDKTPKGKEPFIVDGTTYVPLRTAADILDVPVTWDGKNSAVIIGKKIVGTPLGTPDSVSTDTLTGPSMTSNQVMTTNSKSYGNTGFTIISEHHGVWKERKNVLKYNLSNRYASLRLAVGIDDKSRDFTDQVLRNIVFKDQDGNVLQEVSLGKGAVRENINIDVKGVLTLFIEVSGENYSGHTSMVNFISPVLN